MIEMSAMADPLPPSLGSVHPVELDPEEMDLRGVLWSCPQCWPKPSPCPREKPEPPKSGAAQAPCPFPCQWKGSLTQSWWSQAWSRKSKWSSNVKIHLFLYMIHQMNHQTFQFQFTFMIYFGFVTLLLKTLLLPAHTKLKKKPHYKSLSC